MHPRGGTRLHRFTIRDGAPADVPHLLELWRVAGSVPTPTDTPESLAALLAFDPQALMVAEAGDGVVGSLVVAWDGWRGSFYRLAVHPDERRRGLARELVRRGEERLRERGAVRPNAIAVFEEVAAKGFWESHGYVWEAGQARFVRDLSAPAGAGVAPAGGPVSPPSA
ncbi:MAG: GNAT family N-acetyltransferase [Thermoleophilaceae bacterium]